MPTFYRLFLYIEKSSKGVSVNRINLCPNWSLSADIFKHYYYCPSDNHYRQINMPQNILATKLRGQRKSCCFLFRPYIIINVFWVVWIKIKYYDAFKIKLSLYNLLSILSEEYTCFQFMIFRISFFVLIFQMPFDCCCDEIWVIKLAIRPSSPSTLWQSIIFYLSFESPSKSSSCIRYICLIPLLIFWYWVL